MASKITLSVIKADIGGFVGHSTIHPDLLTAAAELMETAKRDGTVIDFQVTHCGDDLGLIMTHEQGDDSAEIHGLAWNVFETCTQVAKDLKLYGAGQDLLADAFAGNVRGMGPGVAEMSFEERPAEPVIIFFADKTSGRETYGAGRFLYSDGMPENGRLVVDFNKAYNPPCAYNDYSTCTLPPPRNRLRTAVRAGERKYHD